MLSIKDLKQNIKKSLSEAGIDNPDLDASLLLQEITGVSREELLLNNNIVITESQSKKITELVERRIKREPISKILGHKGFWKYIFKVSHETLDPRPDSETIISSVIDNFDTSKSYKILDLGTGTGCLLLSLLGEFKNSEGLGVDVSSGVMSIFQQNADSLELQDRASFLNKSWEDMPLDQQFDIIVSNPPYIENNVIEGLEPEVKNYDPHLALSGGDDGLECYRSITLLLPKLLKKKGKVFFEIGYNQADTVKAILAEGGLSVLEIIPDLAGNDRCIIAELSA